MKILITGGTVFVSRFAAEYFVARGHDVYVLNRNTKPQPNGVKLVSADRNALGDTLKDLFFDAVLDVTAYNAEHVKKLLGAIGGCDDYILISSSAVYPEHAPMPFTENTERGANKLWGDYGMGKIAAEDAALSLFPRAYVIRPPYIYGEYNNVYREAFVFDCADADLPFCVPADELKLQFVHVEDVCRFAEILLLEKPAENIFNIGNTPVTVSEWARACYAAADKAPTLRRCRKAIEQRLYFPFFAYSYELDDARAKILMPERIGLQDGNKRAYAHYSHDKSCVKRKGYIKFISENPDCFE